MRCLRSEFSPTAFAQRQDHKPRGAIPGRVASDRGARGLRREPQASPRLWQGGVSRDSIKKGLPRRRRAHALIVIEQRLER
jgi:hypothetical protein